MTRFAYGETGFSIFLLFIAAAIAFQRIRETFFLPARYHKGKVKFKWTLYLIATGYLISCLAALAEYFLLDRQINYLIVGIGLIFYFSALIIRKWCIRTLGVYSSIFIEVKKQHKIIRNGPYKYLRHPYYASVFIEVLGLTFIPNSYFATISTFFFLLPALFIRIILEEKELTLELGEDYVNYKQTTPVFFPFQILKNKVNKQDRRRRVAITGIGVIAPNGIGKKEFWQAIQAGKSGIKKIRSFDTGRFPVKIGGEITNFNFSGFISSKELRRIDRFTQLGLSSAILAVRDAKLEMNRENSEKMGVIIGTSLAGLGFGEEQYKIYNTRGPERVSPFLITALITSDCPSQISMELGIKGPSLTVSTACSSSSDAIGYAFSLIRSGELDIAIAGGAEAPLTPLALAGFCSAGVLSRRNNEPERASRPFDKNRDGLILSEGGGILILEELNHALKRGAHIYAELIGYGKSCDAYHITQPLPTGKEAARAIFNALQDAKVSPEDVDYINAHGSSTILNDKIETFIIKKVFGRHAYELAVSSTKSMLGHPQGACGAIELIVCALAVQDDILPPTINYEEMDPDCDLDYVPNKVRKAKVNIALSNTFGFGGKNSSLIVNKFRL